MGGCLRMFVIESQVDPIVRVFEAKGAILSKLGRLEGNALAASIG